MAYSMLKPPQGLTKPETAAALLQGYAEVMEIDADELAVLRTLVACRLATSVTLGAYSIMQDTSGNEYLQLHAAPGRNALCAFWNAPEKDVNQLFQVAVEKGVQVRQSVTKRRKIFVGAAACLAAVSFLATRKN
jgi:Ser/Thr protein kinase RdoA (MazF antagonist)